MNRLFSKFFLLLILSVVPLQQISAQKAIAVKIMTTNIRMASPNDGINIWDNRKDWLSDNINFMDVDVLGGQEVTYVQLQDMIERLPMYDYVGVGRNGGDEGEFCPIFYKKNKYILLDKNTFWLSETPNKVNSKGWDAVLPRIVTWVKLEDKSSKKVFFVFNTHFDHRGENARIKSAELLLQKSKEIAGKCPFFVTGDFNFSPSHLAYTKLVSSFNSDVGMKDTYTNALQVYGPDYTFNGFELEPDKTRDRIDYILFNGDMEILKHHIVDGQRGKLYISDHFPILIDALIK